MSTPTMSADVRVRYVRIVRPQVHENTFNSDDSINNQNLNLSE